MKQPTLSVIMANYNHSMYIGEALDAILSQSIAPTEIVISDHSSTDNSVEIINQYVANHKNVRMISTPRSVDVIDQFNKLVSLATGDYLYGAACDDRILPGLFEKSMNILMEYPSAGLCCSDPVFFDNETGVENRQYLIRRNDPSFYTKDEIVKLLSTTNFWIPGHTAIVKKSALCEAGNYLSDLKWHCDWFAFLVVAFRHGICYIPEPLASMRVSSCSYSAKGKTRNKEQREVIHAIISKLKSKDYLDMLPFFQESGVISDMGINLLKTFFHYPDLWNRSSFSLVPRNTKALKSYAYSASPEFSKKMYQYLINKKTKSI